MNEKEKTIVAKIDGKDRPGILTLASRIAKENHLYIKHDRGHTDLDQASVVMQLVGTTEHLAKAEIEMRSQLRALVIRQIEHSHGKKVRPDDVNWEEEGLTVTFKEAREPVYEREMYPYLLRIRVVAPDFAGVQAVLSEFLSSKEINIVSLLGEVYEPPLAIGHSMAALQVLNVRVPLPVIAQRSRFEAELKALADQHGFLDVKCEGL